MVDAVISRFGGERGGVDQQNTAFRCDIGRCYGGHSRWTVQVYIHTTYNHYSAIALNRAILDLELIVDRRDTFGIRSKEISILHSLQPVHAIDQVATHNPEDHKTNDQTLRRRPTKTIGYRLAIRSSYSTDLVLAREITDRRRRDKQRTARIGIDIWQDGFRSEILLLR